MDEEFRMLMNERLQARRRSMKAQKPDFSQSCPEPWHSGMQVFVRTPRHGTITINLKALDTLDILRAKLQAKTACPPQDQQLFLGALPLVATEHMRKVTDQCVIDLNYPPKLLSNDEQALREKQLVMLYDKLVVFLNYELSNYTTWVRTVLRVKLEEPIRMDTMPLVNVAVCLRDLFDLGNENALGNDLGDPRKIDVLKSMVVAWLSNVENDKRIEGALRPLYLNDKKVTVLSELLGLFHNYPSRTEIVSNEEESSKDEGRSLRQSIVTQRNSVLTVMDMFLEFLEIDLSNRCSVKVSADLKTAYPRCIWQLVDLDGDGLFSEDESQELCRVILSRTSLGRLVVAFMCVNSNQTESDNIPTPPHDSPMVQMERASLISLIPSVVRSFVKECRGSTAANLWSGMDKDQDGEVTAEEFKELFLGAFWNAIVVPLTHRLADESKVETRAPGSKESRGSLADLVQPVDLGDFGRPGGAVGGLGDALEGLGDFKDTQSEPKSAIENEQRQEKARIRSCAGVHAGVFNSCFEEETPPNNFKARKVLSKADPAPSEFNQAESNCVVPVCSEFALAENIKCDVDNKNNCVVECVHAERSNDQEVVRQAMILSRHGQVGNTADEVEPYDQKVCCSNSKNQPCACSMM